MDNDGNIIILDGDKTEPLIAADGTLIAHISTKTYEKFQMEGSGLLASGKLINLGGEKHVFKELDRYATPYGVCPQGFSLDPWVSVAANDIEIGTTLYIKALDGLQLPNGLRHNGCVTIDGKSWSFKDCQVDFFLSYSIQSLPHYKT